MTGYAVEWSADGATGWTGVAPAHGGTGTEYRHTGLTAETTYHYRVRGVNAAGAVVRRGRGDHGDRARAGP